MKKKTNYGLSLFLVMIFASSMVFGQDVQNTIGIKNSTEFNAKQDSDNERVWLNLHNDEGAFSQILIGFIDGATNGVDRDYDGKRFFGSNPVAFYSICDGEALAVQGRDLREDYEELPLGIQSTIDQGVTLEITIDEIEGVELENEEIEILLEDTFLNIRHNLKSSSYSFELTEQGTFDNRFKLIIQEVGVLAVDTFNADTNLILANDKNRLKIKTANNKNILSFNVFDYQGRTLASTRPNSNQFSINSDGIKNGTILLIQAELEGNQSISKKLILLK